MNTLTIKQNLAHSNGLSKPEVLYLCKKFFNEKKIQFTIHAFKRMNERNINIEDVWDVLRNADQVVKKVYVESRQEFSYQIRSQRNRQLAIVLKEDCVVIVTCMLPKSTLEV